MKSFKLFEEVNELADNKLTEATQEYNYEGLGDWESDPDFDPLKLKKGDIVVAWGTRLKVDKVHDIIEDGYVDYFDADFTAMQNGKVNKTNVVKGDKIRWNDRTGKIEVEGGEKKETLSKSMLNMLGRLKVVPTNGDGDRITVEIDGQKKTLFSGKQASSVSGINRQVAKIDKFVRDNADKEYKVTLSIKRSKGWATMGVYTVANGEAKAEWNM